MSDFISTTSTVEDDLIRDAVTTWGNVNFDVCQSSEKQNILSENNDFLHSLKFSQEESHGSYDDSCQTHPKEIDFLPPSAIINTQVNSENNNIQTARPNSAYSFNDVSIHINGDHNIVIITKATPSIDPSKPQNRSLPSIEKKVLTVKKGLVPPEVLSVVAEKIGVNWRKLGLDLDFSLHDLDTLYHDHHYEGAIEICYRLLASWRERLGSAATYWTLANALKNFRRLDVIKKCLLTSAE